MLGLFQAFGGEFGAGGGGAQVFEGVLQGLLCSRQGVEVAAAGGDGVFGAVGCGAVGRAGIGWAAAGCAIAGWVATDWAAAGRGGAGHGAVGHDDFLFDQGAQ
ncbi:MAG: hypothetical protein OXU61_04440, partial [Gammaproteobacteria bacterium]|nr:hypothetical protein [Gammaproteobacteria bacterium]